MYMPFMISLDRVLVFGGDRGEGLQKAEKLALFADQLLVVPEGDVKNPAQADLPYEVETHSLLFKAGPVRWVAEKLKFDKDRLVPLSKKSAKEIVGGFWPSAKARLKKLLRGVNYVCSDLADRELNERIHRLCLELNIRHTVVDTKDLSDTWYMSLIDTGTLLAAISTRGGAAYYARKTREELEDQFAERGEMARILTDFRLLIPREKREEALDILYHDKKFRKYMKKAKYQKAWEYAQEFSKFYWVVKDLD